MSASRDIHLGSATHFPSAVLSESDVLDPFLDKRMSERERELTQQSRRVQTRLARCVTDRSGIVRYELRLSPTRARRGPAPACVTRALRRARLSGSGTFELTLNFRGESPAGVYVVDRAHRRSAPPARTQRAAQRPRYACPVPAATRTLRRNGDDDHFPDFAGMRGAAVRQHERGPITEAACAGLSTDVLDPWSRRETNEFERSWARRVRERKVLILACIPPDQRPPSWALTFEVETDGTVTARYDATAEMAECIASRITPPPRRYRLHVNFGESPEEFYVDTR